MVWQTMETAPRDGTRILAWNADYGQRETSMQKYGKGSPGFAEWEKGDGPLNAGWGWQEPQHNWGSTWKPTHWMPLPASPLPDNKVVTALKGDLTQRTTDLMLATAELAAARVQEPVAYEWFDRYGLPHLTLTEPADYELAKKVTPLFAAPVPPIPPVREPLSETEIDALWVLTPEDPDGNDFVLFARAVEAAHGIKEQK